MTGDPDAPNPDRGAGRRMAAAYQGAIEAVIAVVICALAGHWIDRGLGSAPVGLFAGLLIGFAAFVVRLWRMRGLMGGSEPPGDPPESK